MSEVEELFPTEFVIGGMLYEWVGKYEWQIISTEGYRYQVGSTRWIANRMFFINQATLLPSGSYEYNWCLAVDDTDGMKPLEKAVAGLKRHLRQFV